MNNFRSTLCFLLFYINTSHFLLLLFNLLIIPNGTRSISKCILLQFGTICFASDQISNISNIEYRAGLKMTNDIEVTNGQESI